MELGRVLKAWCEGTFLKGGFTIRRKKEFRTFSLTVVM